LRVKTRSNPARAFTLIELLVVVVVIAVLIGLLLPVFASMQDSARSTACVSNLRQIGAGIVGYAADNEGKIPWGPKAPPFTSPSNLYPSTGAPTSLLSLRNGAPVALGLLIDKYLAKTPKVLFCPGRDQPLDADTELANVGKTQAQGSYYYRHAGNTQLFDSGAVTEPANIRLQNLGDNRNEKPVRALVIDSIFQCAPDLDAFNVKPRTNHKSKLANVLYSDGHVRTLQNTENRYTVDLTDYEQLHSAFDKILKVFELADEQP
jgi:prepilin-type N-terminal cleavage/methylation domain-containing protein/prepilin-type processing-associated H-X9-DG protein